ncbi:acyl-CoA dehydrogenase family protein [Methylobacterium nonmethylotrophicum]|uniref:Isovaleryl-CoA dehydrogenase n=1 Tax=Methylobacterium nonmethylotrophicum TaxID=1141884 RepID=A0A4Z0NPU0_9HYPH|nr:acyl-CoA dehydrogenase family protein [Methylobacterium nonmethylotrophicum]TGD98924.1 isovaleryl-CoA dehydrogenase [Methylobacterium nonmethylotrophicum]
MSDTLDPAEIRANVRRFAEREVRPGSAARDREERFDAGLFRRLGDLGVLGALASARYGGAELDPVAVAIIHEELAAADPGLALAYLAHAVLFVNAVARHAGEAQRTRVLPDACSGRTIGAVAMSEAGAGSDLMAMRTTARREGGRYVIEGTKTWITNGALGPGDLGDVALVYARTGEGVRGLSLFLVQRGMPGFRLGGVIGGKLGMRTATCAELVFDGCAVPDGNRVGPEGGAVMMLMRTLEIERLMLAAIALGIARRALAIMNRYASERRTFGAPLREHGQIQGYLAESYAAFRAGRAYVAAAASALAGPGCGADADGAKLYCARMAKTVADHAIQVLGGNGYVEAYEVERLWRDARLLEIGGGTNEMLQKAITRHLTRPETLE